VIVAAEFHPPEMQNEILTLFQGLISNKSRNRFLTET